MSVLRSRVQLIKPSVAPTYQMAVHFRDPREGWDGLDFIFLKEEQGNSVHLAPEGIHQGIEFFQTRVKTTAGELVFPDARREVIPVDALGYHLEGFTHVAVDLYRTIYRSGTPNDHLSRKSTQEVGEPQSPPFRRGRVGSTTPRYRRLR